MKILCGSCLLLVGVIQIGAAQSNSELERALKSLESLAEKLRSEDELRKESSQELMDQYSGDIEAWAEKHAFRWENWAQKFEKQLTRWAAEQEHVWDPWAQEYSQKWEKWAKILESQQVDANNINQMLKGNLRMLAEMPLAETLDGLMKQGAQGLESAPWDSVADLKSALQETLNRTVNDALRHPFERGKQQHQRHTQLIETESDFILPFIDDHSNLPADKLSDSSLTETGKLQQKISESNELDELRDEIKSLRAEIEKMKNQLKSDRP